MDVLYAFPGLLFIIVLMAFFLTTLVQALSVRPKEYIEVAFSVGATNWRSMFRHLLPNILGRLTVLEALSIPGYICTKAFLSSIGLGCNPPTPSWGSVIAFNFLGDGLRHALEPRLRGTQE